MPGALDLGPLRPRDSLAGPHGAPLPPALLGASEAPRHQPLGAVGQQNGGAQPHSKAPGALGALETSEMAIEIQHVLVKHMLNIYVYKHVYKHVLRYVERILMRF